MIKLELKTKVCVTIIGMDQLPLFFFQGVNFNKAYYSIDEKNTKFSPTIL